jgi:hypothetical protein
LSHGLRIREGGTHLAAARANQGTKRIGRRGPRVPIDRVIQQLARVGGKAIANLSVCLLDESLRLVARPIVNASQCARREQSRLQRSSVASPSHEAQPCGLQEIASPLRRRIELECLLEVVDGVE